MTHEYREGYDAVKDVTNDVLELSGTPYKDVNGNRKVILNLIDIMCIFKKYNLLAEDILKDTLTESEKEKLDKTLICEKVF